MTNEDLALRLQETTDRSVRNEGRIKKLEGEHEACTSWRRPWPSWRSS